MFRRCRCFITTESRWRKKGEKGLSVEFWWVGVGVGFSMLTFLFDRMFQLEFCGHLWTYHKIVCALVPCTLAVVNS